MKGGDGTAAMSLSRPSFTGEFNVMKQTNYTTRGGFQHGPFEETCTSTLILTQGHLYSHKAYPRYVLNPNTTFFYSGIEHMSSQTFITKTESWYGLLWWIKLNVCFFLYTE